MAHMGGGSQLRCLRAALTQLWMHTGEHDSNDLLGAAHEHGSVAPPSVGAMVLPVEIFCGFA